MLEPPKGIEDEELLRLIRDEFGVDSPAPAFIALGEDSWCYRLGSLWVSLRRDLRGHVPGAYKGAAELREKGLDFVLAPIAGRDGRVVRDFCGYPLVVFPYVECATFGAAPPTAREAAELQYMLDCLHRQRLATELPAENFELGFSADLESALDAAAAPFVECGPLSSATYRLLRENQDHIRALRTEYGRLAAQCATCPGPLVLSHGEPLLSNVLRHDGRLLLADWGDLMWAPPERDWSHVIRTIGAGPAGRAEFKRLYDIKWALSEIAEYATILLAEHDGDDDDCAMLSRLRRYLPEGALEDRE